MSVLFSSDQPAVAPQPTRVDLTDVRSDRRDISHAMECTSRGHRTMIVNYNSIALHTDAETLQDLKGALHEGELDRGSTSSADGHVERGVPAL